MDLGCYSQVSDAHIEMRASAFLRLYAGKPCERKWRHPLKGSWGYENQVKGSGALTERILGFDVQFSVTGRSTRFVSLVLFIHVMILAQLSV
ncbi:hypothetical protein Syun_006388 [Stephania yunnanensis]|uniref:Uncharacterized protein n=1 Tax=Stephania yunnanensis TaxID=152371 RepID=A0AAP0KWG5_9MAGN